MAIVEIVPIVFLAEGWIFRMMGWIVTIVAIVPIVGWRYFRQKNRFL